MKRNLRLLIGVGSLILAQLACNLPALGGGTNGTATIPSPNQTLTAIFAVTPVGDADTPTLPPVVTATEDPNQGGGQEGAATPTDDVNQGGGQEATATPKPVNAATSTPNRPAATATNRPPAPTATIPSARTNVKAVANYMSKAPNLDGDWSEWKNVTIEYPANTVVFGKKNWKDENDLSASYHVGWDNTYLYIAVKVHDNKYVQNASGTDLYKGDSVEILLDTKLQDDYYYNKLSPDDFQLGISAGRPDPSGTREAYLWYPTELTGKRSDVKIGSKLEDGGYRVEAAIPWTLLEMKPADKMHLGFALSVSDNDNPDKNEQQKMVSNDPQRDLSDPTTWGDLQLVK